MSIFYRLFIPELFPQYDKAVYLDADTIICTDIADLYNTEIGDNMFASCPDLSIRYMPLLQKYIKECQGILPAENTSTTVSFCSTWRPSAISTSSTSSTTWWASTISTTSTQTKPTWTKSVKTKSTTCLRNGTLCLTKASPKLKS